MKALRGLLIAVCIVGCAPQKRLASNVEGSDRIVISRFTDKRTMTVSGEELKKVVSGIASAKKESRNLDCSPDLQLDFFQGDQRLGRIKTCDEIFWIDGKPYKDGTGALKSMSTKYREANPPIFTP